MNSDLSNKHLHRLTAKVLGLENDSLQQKHKSFASIDIS